MNIWHILYLRDTRQHWSIIHWYYWTLEHHTWTLFNIWSIIYIWDTRAYTSGNTSWIQPVRTGLIIPLQFRYIWNFPLDLKLDLFICSCFGLFISHCFLLLGKTLLWTRIVRLNLALQLWLYLPRSHLSTASVWRLGSTEVLSVFRNPSSVQSTFLSSSSCRHLEILPHTLATS